MRSKNAHCYSVGDVKAKLPDEVLMKAYRAAQPERERYTIQRAATSAATRVFDEYRHNENLRQIRSGGVGCVCRDQNHRAPGPFG
jgi:lauroyl/myristoyl acyltransferase